MGDWERFAVHHEGDHGGASVVCERYFETAGKAVDRSAEDLVLAVSWIDNPCFVEQFTQRNASPHGVTDELATHRIGNAGQGDLGRDEFTVEQVFVGVRDGVGDVGTSDCKRPRFWID